MQMQNYSEFQRFLIEEIAAIKKQLVQSRELNQVTPDWLPRKDVMRFLSYGDTQMASLEKSGQIVVSKVGKRKFVNRLSIIKLIEKNIQQNK